MNHCLAQEVADRFNELKIPADAFKEKKVAREFKLWQKGKRVMMVVDFPTCVFVAFRKLK